MVETTKTFDKLQKQIPVMQENILNLEKQSEQNMITTTETLASMTNEMKELHENQVQCLETININNNLTKTLTESLNSGELYCTLKENNKQTEDLEKETKCSATSPDIDSTTIKYKSCQEFYDKGHKLSGAYEIEIDPERTISVYCDMTTDGGGWTVFQRRQDGSIDFYRNWDDYKAGFGDVNGEFWLGNDYLNILTDTVETHKLRVDLENHEGNHAFAKYRRFKVGSESENYKLEVRGYTGDAGNSLGNPSNHRIVKHNGMEFTTKDRDNDKSGTDCAVEYQGAWWYNDCYESNLNSLYHQQSKCNRKWVCIVWNTWKGSQYSMKFTEMKFR